MASGGGLAPNAIAQGVQGESGWVNGAFILLLPRTTENEALSRIDLLVHFFKKQTFTRPQVVHANTFFSLFRAQSRTGAW